MEGFDGMGESLGGAPGPQGMGTGGADTNFEDVEYGDGFVWQGCSFGKGTTFPLTLFKLEMKGHFYDRKVGTFVRRGEIFFQDFFLC